MGRNATEKVPSLSIDALGAEEVGILPWPLLMRRRVLERAMASSHYPWIVLATVLFGLFSVGFTITILSVSIPRMAEEFGSTESTLTWVVSGPILAFAIFGPSAGKLGDQRGHRRVYTLSMSFVVVFAALSAVAWSAGAIIAFRVLGAATGAAVGPTSLALINRMFPPNRRAQAMGYWSMVAAGGPVVGVVAGGPIVEQFGWRWIFVGQVPLTVAGLLLAMAILPETAIRERQKFDVAGAVTLGAAATMLLLAINRGPAVGWTHPLILGGFVLAPVALAVFFQVEKRAAEPLLPLKYLKRRNFSVPILTQVFTNFAYMGGFVITPLLLRSIFDYGETRAGSILIARPLAFSIAGPVCGYLAVKIGERIAAVSGSIAVFLSMLVFTTVTVDSSDLVIMGALMLSGVGLGMSGPALSASIANSVDDADLGVAGATQQMMSQFGVVLGIQLMQATRDARTGAVGETQAFSEAYMLAAAMAFLAVVVACFVRSSPRESDTDDEPVDDDVEVAAR